MARQTTLNVSLTATLQNYVRSKVNSGRYESASEVIRDSLRALQEREKASEAYWAEVRGKLTVARRQVADGNTVDGETAMAEILTEINDPPAKKRRKARR